MEQQPIEQSLITPSTEDIEKRWNVFCFNYSQYSSRAFVGCGIGMWEYVDASEANTILEMGCGDGSITLEFALRMKVGAKLICNDIAENMCKITGERLERLKECIKTGKMQGYKSKVFAPIDCSKIQIHDRKIHVDELNIDVLHADNEHLEAYVPDSSVDKVIASLSLHIVNNPMAMLKECMRVMKPGAMSIFTVWGAKEHSYIFLSVDTIKEKYGIPKSQRRQPWHMNDRNKTIQLFKDAGFVDILTWEQLVPYISQDLDMRRSENKYLLTVDWTQDKMHLLDEAVEAMVQEQNRIMQELNRPLGLNLLYIAATKPSKQ